MEDTKTLVEEVKETKKKQRFCSADRKEQILSIAAEIFSQKGFNGTTTKEIAERLDVSEAIIFRHFPTKQDLYSAILHEKTTELMQPLWLNCVELMQKKDDRGVFTRLAAQILEMMHKDQTLLRLLFYSALEKHQLAQAFLESTARQVREPAIKYIKQRIEDGAFRSIDPILTAKFFFSLVKQWGISRELFQDSEMQKLSPWEAAEEITNIFLFGILQDQNSRSAKE